MFWQFGPQFPGIVVAPSTHVEAISSAVDSVAVEVASESISVEGGGYAESGNVVEVSTTSTLYKLLTKTAKSIIDMNQPLEAYDRYSHIPLADEITILNTMVRHIVRNEHGDLSPQLIAYSQSALSDLVTLYGIIKPITQLMTRKLVLECAAAGYDPTIDDSLDDAEVHESAFYRWFQNNLDFLQLDTNLCCH